MTLSLSPSLALALALALSTSTSLSLSLSLSLYFSLCFSLSFSRSAFGHRTSNPERHHSQASGDKTPVHRRLVLHELERVWQVLPCLLRPAQDSQCLAMPDPTATTGTALKLRSRRIHLPRLCRFAFFYFARSLTNQRSLVVRIITVPDLPCQGMRHCMFCSETRSDSLHTNILHSWRIKASALSSPRAHPTYPVPVSSVPGKEKN